MVRLDEIIITLDDEVRSIVTDMSLHSLVRDFSFLNSGGAFWFSLNLTEDGFTVRTRIYTEAQLAATCPIFLC